MSKIWKCPKFENVRSPDAQEFKFWTTGMQPHSQPRPFVLQKSFYVLYTQAEMSKI